jgi:hypothetical protein
MPRLLIKPMKNIISKISAVFAIILIGWALGSDIAHAQGIPDVAKFFGFDLANFVAQLAANILNVLQMVASWILILAGSLLNYSINLTLQMKDFLAQTPAIYTTWRALRDISGMFIIFFLLYAAMKLIFGFGTKFNDLIKNIVIAGVVINFSFFIASIGIDASNIVSIQLYNAIAPASSLNVGNLKVEGVTERWKDGGLSDIFMKSLKIPALYNTKPDNLTAAGQAANAGGAWTAPIKVMLIGVASIVIMLTAALSFAAAALAFVIRFAVLLFLLAFSPIWFASHIVPEIGSYAKKWTDLYKGMLLFMPVYLLLMYLALNVLTSTPFLSGNTTVAAGAEWYSSTISLAINAVIVIILLNFPLVAAISIGGGAVKFINADKIGAAGMWRGTRNLSWWGAKQAYQGTVARGASAIARSEGLKDFAGSSLLGGAVLKGVRGVANPYEKKLATQVKTRTEFADSLGYNKDAVNRWESRLRNIKAQREALPDIPANTAARADLKRDIDDTERIIKEQKNARKENYADTVDSRSVDTLWTKVARKDKKAAAKIQAGILEGHVKDKKDDLKDVKADMKSLQAAIRNNPAIGTAGAAGYVAAGTATAAQQAEITRLTTRRDAMQIEVNGLEDSLAQMNSASEK